MSDLVNEIVCPKCDSSMPTGTSTAFRHCAGCRGIWVDVTVDVAGEAHENALWKLRRVVAELPTVGQPTKYTCPTCRTRPLTAVTHDGVEIDWCLECQGVYFDHGEIQRLHGQYTSMMQGKSGGASSGFVGAGAGELVAEGAWAIVEVLAGLADW